MGFPWFFIGFLWIRHGFYHKREDAGGDCSSVEGQLKSGVAQIVGTSGAFAALKSDGTVCTWGGA